MRRRAWTRSSGPRRWREISRVAATRTRHDRRRSRGRLFQPRAARRPARQAVRSARPASRSTGGSISTSRQACRPPRRSGGSSSFSTPRRRATPARSTRSPRACCRSRSARRRRPCRSFRTAPRLTASVSDGARKARPTTPRARSSRVPTGRPSPAEIEALLPRFVGDILQTPPTFSAIRIDGAPPYDLAREGETFEIQPRTIQVYRLDLISAERDTAVL